MSERWQFDIKKDLAVIEAGGFFCAACIVGKPAAEQSSDPRYCRSCYEIIQNVTPTGAFVPVDADDKPQDGVKTPPTLAQQGAGAVTTMDLVEGSVLQSDVTAKIKVLAGQGKSTREIAAVLQAAGIKISHMTIARRLQAVMI